MRFILEARLMDCVYSAPTPTAGTPKISPPSTPQLTAKGPSQLLTALLARLPDATNRAGIDQVALEFTLLNSKAARKRLVKVRVIDVERKSTTHRLKCVILL